MTKKRMTRRKNNMKNITKNLCLFALGCLVASGLTIAGIAIGTGMIGASAWAIMGETAGYETEIMRLRRKMRKEQRNENTGTDGK